MRKILVGIFVCTIFLVRFITYENIHRSQIPDDWFDKKITVTGIITEDPDRGLEKTKITLGEFGIFATLQNGTTISYGDEVTVTGIIKHPENFMTDTDREFDYINYLKVRDIYGLMNVSSTEIISRHNKSMFIETLFLIKKYFVTMIKNLFPRNEAGLFAGIVIGEKSLLPKDVLSDFQIAGLTHMIVLSGYNITLVALVIITIFSYLGFGYRGRRVGAMIVIPIFLVMTGLGASSVRAGIMSLILFFLQITTRPTHHLRIILYTVGTMIFINPRVLLHDPGFHLSFLAFIGLVYVVPLMNTWLNKNESESFLKKIIIETTSVQLFVLPYIIWMSGRVSLLSLLANILTVPIVPLIMAGGFFVTVTGMILYSLGAIATVPITFGLSYIIWVAHQVALVKMVTFTVPPFGAWVMIGVYGVIMIYLTLHHKNDIL